MMKIMVINGPNLNLLGVREPSIYGNDTYSDLCTVIDKKAKELDVSVDMLQSNHEGEIVDFIHRAYEENIDGIVINPAAYTHTSVALLDALKSVSIPAIEVHISNVNSREDFRKISYVSEACIGVIAGFGFMGYELALEAICKICKESR